MTTVAVIYHSASGRTKALAHAVVDGAMEVAGTTTHLFSVEDGARMHAVLAAADAIVFGCPTYMGSASAPFKAFMDSTSTVWALQGWRDRIAGAFTHSAALSGDKLGTLTQLAVFAAQHGMVWVGLGLPPSYAGAETLPEDTNRLGSHLGAMAQSRPGSSVPPSDLRTASLLGRRVAEAARRWNTPTRPATLSASVVPTPPRHEAARGWVFPPPLREPVPEGIARTNLREMVARPERFEHHLVVCASIDNAQLEIAAAAEPLYFAHINLSDEYAITLQSGDDLVDRFPLRTFLSDPTTAEDVGRYNHRVGDLVLHPEGWLHWPGRLRAPYEPFDFPPGMRRAGLSLVYCASEPTAASSHPLPIPPDRAGDMKAYREPAPPMVLASLRSQPGPLATIGRTTLSLVELPEMIAPPHGGWVVVLEAMPGHHAACDLYRIAEGATLDAVGIVRALVLVSSVAGPDPVPSSWKETPPPPFPPFEEGPPGTLPIDVGPAMTITEHDARSVNVTVGGVTAEVPRYWLARLLFRVGLHRLRLGYVETYGGFFVDDRVEVDHAVETQTAVRFGIRIGAGRHAVEVPREGVFAIIERFYRAIAPVGYTERPT